MTSPRRLYRRLLLAGMACLAIVLVVVSQTGPSAESGPMQVTTDTTAYCDELASKVDSLRQSRTIPDEAEATRLASEGRQMCDTGLIRGGLIRLRRALLMLTAQK